MASNADLTSCFICGKAQSSRQHLYATGDHAFWSEEDAMQYAEDQDRHMTYSPEAAYVSQHRAY